MALGAFKKSVFKTSATKKSAAKRNAALTQANRDPKAELPPSLTDLVFLLSAMLLTMVMHFSYFLPWVSGLIVLFACWRLLLKIKGWPMPKVWLLWGINLLGIAAIYLQNGTLFGRDASVAFLALMIALKFMETNVRRDFVVLIFAGYFFSITTFLFSQSLLLGLYLMVPVFALTASLVGNSYPNGTLALGLRLRTAAALLLQGLPIMLLLFLLFPRIPGPLWGVPQDAYKSMSGLSDEMEPGSISELSLSPAVAFRAEFERDIPAAPLLYWRGPVLNQFDGRRWLQTSQANEPEELENSTADHAQSDASQLHYSVTLEPHNRAWLFMLDIPLTLPEHARFSPSRQVLADKPVRTRIRYAATSQTQYRLAPDLSAESRSLNLQLPERGNPRSRALAQQWRGQAPQQIIRTALNMLHEQGFAYTLSPPPLGSDSVDEFLFKSKRGFCEHYAGSFVFLMRAAGIPARVVLGYQGGELNPVGRYLIVRQSSAHAWTEVWLQDKGWVRVDPTAAVAPGRVERGLNFALPNEALLPLMSRPEFPLLRKLYQNWDALNNGWNQWVLGYNQQRQLELFSRLTGKHIDWTWLISYLLIGLFSILGLLSLLLFQHKRGKTTPMQRLYQQYLRRLAQLGVYHQQGESPTDLAKRASLQLPQHAATLQQITSLYLALRYGLPTQEQTVAEFRLWIEKLKP